MRRSKAASNWNRYSSRITWNGKLARLVVSRNKKRAVGVPHHNTRIAGSQEFADVIHSVGAGLNDCWWRLSNACETETQLSPAVVPPAIHHPILTVRNTMGGAGG